MIFRFEIQANNSTNKLKWFLWYLSAGGNYHCTKHLISFNANMYISFVHLVFRIFASVLFAAEQKEKRSERERETISKHFIRLFADLISWVRIICLAKTHKQIHSTSGATIFRSSNEQMKEDGEKKKTHTTKRKTTKANYLFALHKQRNFIWIKFS